MPAGAYFERRESRFHLGRMLAHQVKITLGLLKLALELGGRQHDRAGDVALKKFVARSTVGQPGDDALDAGFDQPMGHRKISDRSTNARIGPTELRQLASQILAVK